MAKVITTLAPGARSVGQSGSDLAWLATAAELDGVSGRYYSARTPRESSALSYDTAQAERLWQASLRLVGLQPA
jgi:protochlorophyllide reductase